MGKAPIFDSVFWLSKSAGISSSGYAQANLLLKPGTEYYSSVRAVTNAGNVLESVSDGFTVDRSPPVVTLDRYVGFNYKN